MTYSYETYSEESNSSQVQAAHCCKVCNEKVDEKVYRYSRKHFGKPLCLKHQGTKQSKKLYYDLKKREVDCELEWWDGYKHVDIAITDARLCIEIDGRQHLTDFEQLWSDLRRESYSAEKGLFTIRIPNEWIDKHAEEIADSIAKLVDLIKSNIKRNGDIVLDFNAC